MLCAQSWDVGPATVAEAGGSSRLPCNVVLQCELLAERLVEREFLSRCKCGSCSRTSSGYTAL